jgi:hypothetical protein
LKETRESLLTVQLNPTLIHAVIGMEVPVYEGWRLIARVRIATARISRWLLTTGQWPCRRSQRS